MLFDHSLPQIAKEWWKCVTK